MPGTMSSGRFRTNAALEARASQLEAEEYSSSFFDDYDEEEDEGDNFDDEYEDSGDEFDENTLWEIASLLRTDVPSKNSLFLPELGSSVIDEYIVEESSEDEGEMLFDATFHDVSEETPTATPLYLRTQDEVIRTSLWAADDQATLSRTSFGLQQPEEGVWQSYIPSDAGGVRSRSAIGEPAQLESDQLWMSTSQALSVKSSLWMPTSWPTIDSRHFGLSQPDLAIWEMYLPDNAGIIRSQSRIEEPGTIQSTSLWQATRELVEDVQSSLWAAPSLKIEAHMNAPLSTSPSLQPERGDPAWEKKYLVLPESEASDLSITNITKLDSGITPAAPVAVSTVTKSSANEEPVHKFTAQRLWKNTPKLVARTTGKRQTMWSPTSVRVANTTGLFHVEAQRKNYKTTTADPAALKMTTKPRKSSAPLSQLLTTQFWNPVGQEKVEADWIRISSGQGLLSRPSSSTTSLFQIDSDRKQWRTTLAEPAALQMTIKSRTVLTPMPTLESDRLWYPTRATDDDFDWITISSVRPRSPSILSIASTDSTLSSPVTDASSIRTASTKASTVALSVSSFTNVRDFFEQRKKAGSVFPEVPEEGEIPDIPEEPLVATNFDYIPSSEYTQVPYRLRIATSADWELALQEAIEASHMSPKIVRGTASPKEWSIALNQAITASYPRNRFSRGQVLPAQWDEELCEAIAKTQRPLFDVSKRHPVFFGSMTTTSADVHPAMFGMALQALSIAAEQSSL